MIQYEHPEMISDFREALGLLCPEPLDGSHRYLRAEPANSRRIFIFMKSGGTPVRLEFPITNKVFRALTSSTWTHPIYANNIYDRTKRIISNSGAQAYRNQFRDALIHEVVCSMSTPGTDFEVLIHQVNGTYYLVAEKPTGDLRGKTVIPMIVEAMLASGLLEVAPLRTDTDGKPLTYPQRFQLSSSSSADAGSAS